MDNPEKLHPTVLDTGAEQLGKVYARALISAADRVKAADQVVDELGGFVDGALRSNPALATALASPRISEEEKCRVIDRLLGGKARCDSRPAAGTRWRIEIPSPAAEGSPAAASLSPPPTS